MKICFAFITKGKINNELVWYNYLKDIKNIEILIHCNETPQFQYLNNLTDNIYLNKVDTAWGHLQGVQNYLLQKSLDLKCDKFIILSDSCLPIRSFDYLYNKLNHDKSILSNCEIWPGARGRFPNSNYEYKLMANQQWVILDKRHFNIFLSDEIKEHFELDVILPEESYFSTVIEKNGLNNDDNIISAITTFVDWSRSPNGNSPYTFGENNINDETLLDEIIKNKDILFIRKVLDGIERNFVKKISNFL